MSILQKHLVFVNEQIAVQDKLVIKFAPNARYASEYRYTQHMSNAERFRAMLIDMETVDKRLDALPDTSEQTATTLKISTQLLPKDIEGLPPELIEELSVNNADKLEFALLGIFGESGGILSLDHMLISLYKKSGEVHKRAAITAKLYRMSQKGLAYSVPGKKGWYSTEELTETRVEEIFKN